MLDTMATLKAFDADRVDLDELVALAVGARLLRDEYAQHRLATPDWLNESTREVRREIEERRRDFKARQLRTLESKLEARLAESLTVADIEKQIGELRSELDEV